jgi:hypothetical protein
MTAQICVEPLPELDHYWLHRTVEGAALEGVAVPGLRARFYRRELSGGQLASVGYYTYAGRELLMAWGFVDEEHCRFHAVRDDSADGQWGPTVGGCPTVDVVRDGDRVVGLRVLAADGSWAGHPGMATARRS